MSEDDASLSAEGRRYVCEFGVDLDRAAARRRVFCRACLDWSERRFHIGGVLGAALLDRFIAIGWLRRTASGRALTITRAGEAGFAREFGYRSHEARPSGRVLPELELNKVLQDAD